MQTTIRGKVHEIIDRIEDEGLLKQILDWLNQSQNSREGQLWNDLTEEQRIETLKSLEESNDPQNLLSQEEMKKKHGKWL